MPKFTATWHQKKPWGISVLRHECNSHSQGSATHERKQKYNITNKDNGKRLEERQNGEIPLLCVTQDIESAHNSKL